MSDSAFLALVLSKDENEMWSDEDGSLWQGSTLLASYSKRTTERWQALEREKP